MGHGGGRCRHADKMVSNLGALCPSLCAPMHHGLQHDPATLAALPVLAAPPRPVRALDAPAFAALHLQHTLAHPPDHVLFPFLHGLEGDNHAQNTFFASSAFAAAAGTGAAGAPRAPHPHHYHAHAKRIVPRVPRYRGLVWVVCEEDLERAGDAVTLRVLRRRPQEDSGEGGQVPSSDSDEDELEDDSTSDAESFQDDLALDEDEQNMMMLVGQPDSPSPPPSASPSPASPASPPLHLLQTPLPPPHPDNIAIASADTYAHSPSPSALSDLGLGITLPEDMGLVAGGISKKGFVAEGEEKDANSYEGVHMHPVARRTTAATDEASSIPSTSSSASSSSLAVDQPPSNSSGSGVSLAVDTPPSSAEETGMGAADADPRHESQLDQTRPQAGQDQPRLVLKHPTDPNAPPLLCSTFRPKELLRRKRTATANATTGASGKKENVAKDGRKEEDWEFVPARVPDGISLRNFGIQVVSLFRLACGLPSFLPCCCHVGCIYSYVWNTASLCIDRRARESAYIHAFTNFYFSVFSFCGWHVPPTCIRATCHTVWGCWPSSLHHQKQIEEERIYLLFCCVVMASWFSSLVTTSGCIYPRKQALYMFQIFW